MINKKLTILLLIVILILSFSSVFVSAEENVEYYRIDAESIKFYLLTDTATKNDNVFIILPKSYYVKVATTASTVKGFTKYFYNGYDGLIANSDTKNLVAEPKKLENPYFNFADLKVVVPEVADFASFYPQALKSNPEALSNTATITYIGSATNASDEKFYCVKKGDAIGYILYTHTNQAKGITIPAHAGPIIVAPPADDGITTPPPVKPTEPNNNLLKTLLIVAIVLLSVLLVFLIFKPVKSKHKDKFVLDQKDRFNYYDDDRN